MLCEFASGARGTFEASRSIVGPESQMAFEVYGTKGALGWNLEKLNELQLYLVEDDLAAGYRTVFGGDRFPYHGHFVPGSANGIGFEDLVVIEDHEFCRSVAQGRPHEPGFEQALEWVGVQDALLRSAASGRWEDVVSLREA
jgi:predicted dehydrogenase